MAIKTKGPSKLELENLKLQRLNATLKPLVDDYEETTTSSRSAQKKEDKKKTRSTRKRWESTSSEEEVPAQVFNDML
jgi:hypothetical protein